MGSVSGALGRLAELRENAAHAVERYQRAIELEEQAGALIWAVHHRLRLGEALLASGDQDGQLLLKRVADDAPRLGLPQLAQRAHRAATPQTADRRTE
jgi:hypothetical protein